MSIDLDDAYRRYRGQLLRHAGYLCRSPAGAEDLVQDTFVEAARTQDDVKNIFPWLRGILHHMFIRSIRRPQPSLEFDDFLAPPQESTVELFFVDRAMSHLSEKQRNAIRMSAVDGMSATEIGAALGISAQGGSDILRRGRKLLREHTAPIDLY